MQLLGRFSVTVNNQTVPDSAWRLKKGRSLVKLLVLSPGFRLNRESVMDLLWPDMEPHAAANNLYQVIHVVRRAISAAGGNDSDYLRVQSDAVILHVESQVWTDVGAFRTAATEAERAGDLGVCESAARLYRGELLPDDLYEDWVESNRDALRQKYLSLLFRIAQLNEVKGDYSSAIEAFSRAIDADPINEIAHREKMRLLAISGRRQDALRQFQVLADKLRADLATEPDRATLRLHQEILADRLPLPGVVREKAPPSLPAWAPRAAAAPVGARPQAGPAGQSAPTLPPQLTSFVGRERELTAIDRLLLSSRLVTLTGIGGCGKTRLAVQVAATLASRRAGDIVIVQLADLGDPSLVPQAVASAAGIRTAPGRQVVDALTESLRARNLLLILDNCEHLLEPCASLAGTLLGACPAVRILATSRERLRVPGEAIFAVPPMAVPPPEQLISADRLRDYDALRLFVERAVLINPRFRLNEKNAEAVVRICRRLDGIPLAIELAAGRVNALSLVQIGERLENSLRLLTDGSRTVAGRHKTIRAAMDWSFGLLRQSEAKLFARLSVFHGGFTLEAVEQVCGNEARQARPDGATEQTSDTNGSANQEVLEVLLRLVEKSLVAVEEDQRGIVRYRLLETVRQYALERLGSTPDARKMLRRHLEYFLQVADAAETRLEGPAQIETLDTLDKEHDNLRSALTQAGKTGDVESGTRLAADLWRFWLLRGYFAEGRGWLADAISKSQELLPAIRAKALNGAATLAWHQADYDRATAHFRESLDLLRQAGDLGGVAHALNNLGAVAYARGDYAGSVALREEALDHWRKLGDKHGIAQTLNNLGLLARDQGRFDRAQEMLGESLTLFKGSGDAAGVALCIFNLGVNSQYQGDHRRAASLLTDSLSRFEELSDKWGRALALSSLGLVSKHLGEHSLATQRLIESVRLFQDLGDRLGVIECLEGLASLAQVTGSHDRAATLFAACDALRNELGAPLPPGGRAQFDTALADVRARLTRDEFVAASDRGRAMTMEQAVAYASVVLDKAMG